MVNAKATLDAEYSVIGSLLLSPEITGELLAVTHEDDFTVPELRAIYKAAEKLFTAGRPVDAVTIRGICGAAYNDLLMQCMDVTPSARPWRTYVSAMQEQTCVYRLHEIAAQLASCRTSAEGRVLVSQAAAATGERSGTQIVGMMDAMLKFYDDQSTERKFIAYGLDKLDTRLYSDYGDFVILAGRPSAGKTALGLQMAAHMAQSAKVGFYSLETSPAKLTNRLIANRAIVDFGHINQRKLTQEEMERIVRLQGEITALDLEMIPASGWTVQDILSTALRRRHKIVFIDYLQQLQGKGKDRFEQVTRISLDLHAMAQTHGILVVALSQLSRAATSRADAAPTMTDLRESGQIEQDADTILALYIDPDEDAPLNSRRLRVLKNKEGRLGELVLNFEGDIQQFCEYQTGELATARHITRMEKRNEAKKSNPKAAV